ncbi:NUDIX hydrolase [Candidatus Saccharibacteria bacterium]|nr:NUDIX hydrolase [Candidatus Saccharibacteria bacterium]
MNAQNYFRVSVKGIAIDETGRFLLAKEANGMWEILGGGLDHGEDPIAGLRREVDEEAGVEITYVSPSPKYFTTTQRMGSESYIANVIYEIKLKNMEFKHSDECTELRFFNVEEARKVKLYPSVEKFLDVFNPKFH